MGKYTFFFVLSRFRTQIPVPNFIHDPTTFFVSQRLFLSEVSTALLSKTVQLFSFLFLWASHCNNALQPMSATASTAIMHFSP
jgi:hypothetical protein